MLTQALGLFLGIPFLFFTGWAASVPGVVLGMIGFGYCKGIYDANIFASLYDVVPVRQRGTAAGMMNSLGWLGGGFAPIAIALAANRYGMGEHQRNGSRLLRFRTSHAAGSTALDAIFQDQTTLMGAPRSSKLRGPIMKLFERFSCPNRKLWRGRRPIFHTKGSCGSRKLLLVHEFSVRVYTCISHVDKVRPAYVYFASR